MFTTALTDPDRDPADTYAASLGLGKAELWLGDYAAAASAFALAREHAVDQSARQAANTGLAQSLNAQDYPRAAYALVAPFAKGQLRPTLEVLRAMESLGWQDKSPAYLDALTLSVIRESGVSQVLRGQEDVAYAVAPQVEGSARASRDSDGLEIQQVGSAFRFAPRGKGAVVQTWGMAADRTRVSAESRSWNMDSLSVTSQLRVNDIHRIDLDIGAARIDAWDFAQGASSWTRQSSDHFSVTAAAERAPILTDLAIGDRLIFNTYSLGAAFRPYAHWYVLPTYYRQTFSDGNARDGGTLRILINPYDLPETPAAIGAELSTRVFHSTRPSRGVYFNPESYRVTQLSVSGIYALNPDWKLRANAGAGRQFIDGSGADVYSVGLSADGRLPSNGRLKLVFERSSAASGSSYGGPGYWSENVMLSIRYPL
ncbi:MAG: hypothetical protein ABIO84_10030 [Lysobacter sp.]